MNSAAVYILGFFGAVFGWLTIRGVAPASGPVALLPFVGAALLALAAYRIGRGLPRLSFAPVARRAIIWSTIGELLGIMIGVQLAVTSGRPDLVLPAVALAVGLHFLPIGHWMPRPRFTMLGVALSLLALAGFLLSPPVNMAVAGIGGCLAEWAAALSILSELAARHRADQS